MKESSDLLANADKADNETTQDVNQTRSEQQEPTYFSVPGKYMLKEGNVDLHKEPYNDSTVLAVLNNGEVITVNESLKVAGRKEQKGGGTFGLSILQPEPLAEAEKNWLSVRQHFLSRSLPLGASGFISSDTQMEQVVSRFRIERLAFVGIVWIVSIIINLITGTNQKGQAQGAGFVAGLVSISVPMIYFIGKFLLGFSLLFEILPATEKVAKFDLRRLAIEPLIFILMGLVVGIVLFGFALVRACI